MTGKQKLSPCPQGMSDSWVDFPWERYSGGVEVTFAMVSGKVVWLVKTNRWCYELKQLPLGKAQTLQDVATRYFKYLQDKDVVPTLSDRQGLHLQATSEKGNIFHALVLVPVLYAGSQSFIEGVNDTLMLSGLVGSNPMARFIPSAMGWKDAHLMDEPEKLAA